ncbi:LANO_0E15918g1_1 [Lachancea nothofagi CBS 11611]|uniref:Cargo-transport protein YPP1 n=1 Tax=Lachancea nothofagi CBS 11611 TaxID=1266666 RepID=A0A1G4K1P7_9SACH|nr:LANO_0E15918g1_1 [Lachancea nothofagi CBS 11611]
MTQDFEDTETALEDRLLGSGVFNCRDKLLNALLGLQYRTHYHVFGAAPVNASVCRVLLEELGKYDYEGSNPSSRRIGSNLAGILYFHLSDTESAQKKLVQASQTEIGSGPFQTFLKLETLYYTGLLKPKAKATEFYLQNLLHIVDQLPKESHALTFHYLDLIIARLSMSWDQTMSNLAPCNVTYYVAVKSDPENHDDDLLKIGSQCLKSSKFPTAEETNDSNLEQFHTVLQYYFLNSKSSKSSQWHDLIVQSMGNTFQSMQVSKTAMIYFGLEKQQKESTLNFINFLNYNENHRDLNRGEWLDIVSIIESYRFITAQVGILDIPHIFNYREVVRKFELLLCEFYEKLSLPLIEKEKSLDLISNGIKLFLPQKILIILAQSWNALYEHDRENLDLLQDKHSFFLANAFVADSSCDQINFNYAYTLALKREVGQAIKFIKTAILEKEPENYRAWHLLALCESTHEDKNVSFRIVCSVLQALQLALHEGTSISVSDRWQLIQLKLTQLSITKEMFGVEDALELLPEVFELLSLAFPEELDDCNLSSEFNKSQEYLQQSVWLFAVKLYMSNGSVDDAREALAESRDQTAKFQNLNNDLADGYMSLGINDGNALKSFEKVLFYDQLNVDAIVGFAKCLMPDTLEDEHHKLVEKSRHELNKDGFIGEKDRSAAFARLKLLLEELVEKSIEGSHSPEVWWCLSRVYEHYDDSDREEISLWNCVKFQELQPIRDFKLCNF